MKSPCILGGVLEKSLNVVAWKMFFLMLFGCLRQNINHNSEKLKVTEKLAKLAEQTGQDLKSSKNRLGMWIFVQYLKSHSW